MLGLGGNLCKANFTDEFVDLASFSNLAFYFKNATQIAVDQWKDQSGNDNHMAQESAGLQAQVSSGALFFDGSDDQYDLASGLQLGESEEFSLFWAGSIANHTTSHTLLSAEEGSYLIIKNADEIELQVGEVTTTMSYANGSFPHRTNMQLCIRKNTDRTIDVFKNGSVLTPASSPDSGTSSFLCEKIGFTTNEDYAFSGKVYELALYQEALSAGKIEIITDYLSHLL
jgi:hypothetical protein